MDANVYRSDIRDKIIRITDGRRGGDASLLTDCDEVLAYGDSQREKALIGFAHYSKACIYYTQNEVADFFIEMLTAREILHDVKEYADYAMANLMLGTMSICRGNIPEGLDYYERALHCCKEYKLVDSEWVVHYRLGTVYQILDDFEHAQTHFTQAMYYIEGHSSMEGRYIWTAAVYQAIGECYLKKDEPAQANVYLEKIENECRSEFGEITTVLIDCFAARVYAALGDNEKYREYVSKSDGDTLAGLPLMDVFDDLYCYLKLLLEKRERDFFFSMLEKVREITVKSRINFLQKKLLLLKLRAEKTFGDTEAMKEDAVAFYELSEVMSREDTIVMKREIERRNKLKELMDENLEMVKEKRSLITKSETDDLTGIYNRHKLNSYGDVAMERAARNGTPIAIEIMDIDFFSEYNDHYGIHQGDNCLRFVSDMIVKIVKNYGAIFAARYGGAEFVLIYEGYSDKEVFGIAKELRDAVGTKRVENRYAAGKNKFITVSQGIYWGIPEEETKLWDFMHAADNVRYRLKQKSAGSIMVGKAENSRTASYNPSVDGIEMVDPIIRYRGNIEDM